MQLTLRIDYGNGPEEVTTSLWAIVAWERKYKTKASQLAQGVAIEDLAYLAYESLRAEKRTVPAVFDDFLRKCVAPPEIVSSEARPTKGEADDDS